MPVSLREVKLTVFLHDRTDDLFSDPTAQAEAKLLLEKNSHILLRIHLDQEQGKLNVNDEPLDILSHQPISVSGLKVEVRALSASVSICPS